MNPVAQKLTGWNFKEAKGQSLESVFKIINSKTRKTVEDPVKKVLNSGQIIGLANHTVLLSKDGSEYQISDSGAPIKDKTGNISGVVLVFRDVTEEYRMQTSLEENEEKNRGLEIDVKQKIYELEASQRTMNNLLNNLPGFAYQCLNDKDWTMQYISQGCKKITGYSPDDFTTNNTITFNEIIHPDYQEHLWNTWQKKLNLKTVFQEEYPITNANGDTKWIWEQGSGVFQNDKLLYIEGFIEDITQRKTSEDKFKNIFNQSPIGIALVNSITGKIFQVNSKYCQILGLPEKEITQLTWQSLTHPDDIQKDLDQMAKLNAGETNGFAIEKRLKQPDGSFVWVTLTTAKIDILNSEAACHLSMLTDISERKQLTQSLINAKETAEESDRLKSVFLATMSHELRTPLNAVIGFSGLIKADLPLEDILHFSEIISMSGKHLLGVIEDVFDISLIETGDIKIETAPLSITTLLNEVHEIIKNEQVLQNKEHLDLILNNSLENQDTILFSDQKRIKQNLINLLKNALKFTKEGRITFGCNLHKKNQTKIHSIFCERYRHWNSSKYATANI
jgi:PAS domain S-box-containing protein